GDKILDKTLDQIGGKGLFVRELDQALLENRVDFTVHSLKDLPMEIPPQLPLAAFSRREDPRDVLVLPLGATEMDPSK
ncbi:hydroxymethylbilane synthase, partial [Acinetobacter baumannii]|nr:hydroxymethylbilane synthase [Acinetobacter baumannii]